VLLAFAFPIHSPQSSKDQARRIKATTLNIPSPPSCLFKMSVKNPIIFTYHSTSEAFSNFSFYTQKRLISVVPHEERE
jgi:hypothetical protein